MTGDTVPFKVGDIIQIKGPTVPRDCWDKFFRVEAVGNGDVRLSLPYLDRGCTQRYHPVVPNASRPVTGAEPTQVIVDDPFGP